MFQNRKKGKGEGGGERDTWSAGPGRQYKTNIIKYYSASFGSCFSSSFLLTVLLEAPAGGLLQGAPRLGGAHAFRAAPRHLRVKVTVPSCSEEMLSLASTDHFISASCYRFYTILFPDSKFGQKFQRSLQNGVVLFFVAFFLLPLASLLDSLRRSGSVLHAALGRKARSPTFSDTNSSFSQNMASLSLSPHPPKSSSSASQLHPMSSFSQLLKCHKYSLSRDMPGTARGECNYTSFPLSSSKLAFPNEFKQMLPDANLHLFFLPEPCSGSSCSSLRLACGYQSALAWQ